MGQQERAAAGLGNGPATKIAWRVQIEFTSSQDEADFSQLAHELIHRCNGRIRKREMVALP